MPTVNLTIDQGATWNWSATLLNEDDVTKVRTPVNFTGATAAMMIRKRITDASPIISLTSSNGITLGGAAGTIAMTLGSAVTGALASGTAIYDFELTQGAVVSRLFSGTVTITPEVTHS